MDAALSLFYRDILKLQTGPVYLWCDSSPQLGEDYLLSIFDYIQEEQVVSCWNQAQNLFSSVAAFQKAFAEGDEGEVEDQANIRHHAGRFLKQHIHRHRQMPMGLGSGASSLQHKARALAMKFAHESHDVPALRSICRQVCSLTVDMGVEVGLAEVAGGDVNDYLPPWMQDRQGLLMDEGMDGLEELVQRTTHLFPRAFVSTGLDHISNNLQNDLDQKLSGWSGWLPKFKALSNLLSKRHHLKRLVARCIMDTPFSPLKRMFETTVEPCAKWRWGTICKTLPAILALHRPLGMIWSKAKFEVGRNDQDEERNDDAVLDLDLVTAAVTSPSWFAYGQMILHLHEIANSISGWGSGCACHEWLRPHKQSSDSPWESALSAVRQSLGLESGLDGLSFQCPLAGKRAPELASGALLKVICERIDDAFPKVLVESAGAGPEHQEQILSDFNLGTGYIKLVVELKLGHWNDFPWVLCKLGLPGDAARQQGAADMLATFDSLPQDPKSHHRVTLSFMATGSALRSDMEALAGGAPINQLPALANSLARLCFLPVSERIVEGEHSIVHRHGGYRKVTGAYVSCSQRLPEVDALMSNQETRTRFLQAFEKTRKLKNMSKLFRFCKHPQWTELMAKPKKERSGVQKLANAILYSVDVSTQFLNLGDVRAKHQAQKRACQKVEESLLPKVRVRLCHEAVLNHALADHVCNSLKPGGFYSMPTDSFQEGGLTSLSVARCFSSQPRPSSSIDAALSLDLPGQTPGQEERPHVFFKVLTTGASRLKVTKAAPAGKLRLKKGDVAITLHKAELDEISKTCFVESRPIACSDLGNPVHILSGFGLRAGEAGQVLQWERSHDKCQFTLPHFQSVRHAALINQFLELQAFEGKPHFVQENLLSRPMLQELLHEGWAVASDNGWQLTAAALRQVCVAQRVGEPKQLFTPASGEVPLADQTIWQLCVTLNNLGWQWKPFSRKSPIEGYMQGKPRVWTTAGVTVKKEYVLCLLSADKLFEQQADCVIHHEKPVAYYRHLLQGEFELACHFLEELGQRSQLRLADRAELTRDTRPMIMDEGIEWCLGVDSGVAPVRSTPAKRKRQKPPEHSDGSDCHSSAKASSFDSVGEFLDEFFDSEPEPELAEVAEEPDLAGDECGATPEPIPKGKSEVARKVQPDSILSWGIPGFRITWRAPSSTHVHGAWQGTCTFHRHSATTRCTKSVNVGGDSDTAREQCLLMVKNWLVQAEAFDRAWKHREWNPRSHETPPPATLEAKASSMGMPPDPVLADGDHDSATAKAKGKAKPKPATKRRGKASAKPKATAGSASRAGSKSSSSSSSGSTSSDSESTTSDSTSG